MGIGQGTEEGELMKLCRLSFFCFSAVFALACTNFADLAGESEGGHLKASLESQRNIPASPAAPPAAPSLSDLASTDR